MNYENNQDMYGYNAVNCLVPGNTYQNRPRDLQERWGGLRLSNSSSGNVVSHCVLQNGGSSSSSSGYAGTSLLYIGKDCKLTLTDKSDFPN